MLASSRGACNGKNLPRTITPSPELPPAPTNAPGKTDRKTTAKNSFPVPPAGHCTDTRSQTRMQRSLPCCRRPLANTVRWGKATRCWCNSASQTARQKAQKLNRSRFWSWPDQRKSRVNTGASSAQSQNNEPKISSTISTPRKKRFRMSFDTQQDAKTQEQREHHVEILKFQNAVLGKRHRERHL